MDFSRPPHQRPDAIDRRHRRVGFFPRQPAKPFVTSLPRISLPRIFNALRRTPTEQIG